MGIRTRLIITVWSAYLLTAYEVNKYSLEITRKASEIDPVATMINLLGEEMRLFIHFHSFIVVSFGNDYWRMVTTYIL